MTTARIYGALAAVYLAGAAVMVAVWDLTVADIRETLCI